MILGFAPFTFFHIAISLVGIWSGFVVLRGMFASRRLPGWTAVFLVTTILTNATGFFFLFFRLLPSHIIGAISLVMDGLIRLIERRATAWQEKLS